MNTTIIIRKIREILLIESLLISSLLSAQTVITQDVEEINGKLYVVEREQRHLVYHGVLTVKVKNGIETIKGTKVNSRGYAKLDVPQNMDILTFAKELGATKEVESIIFNTEVIPFLSFNDNSTSTLWHLARIHATDAWDITTGDPNIRLAVIDTGINADHPDLGVSNGYLYSNVSKTLGWNYITGTSYSPPSLSHGTQVAGVIGAKTNNGMGTAGVCGGNAAQGITILPYYPGTTTVYIADAIDDAVDKGVKVINISMGFAFNQEIEDAIINAYNNGVSIVCATGNNGNGYVSYPASSAYTIGVGASDSNNLKSDFSQYGVGTDLVAPGESIYSTALGNTYVSSDGTSFAAPQVAGTIVLMLSVNPFLTPLQIKVILKETATKIGASVYSYASGNWCMQVGNGLLNTYKAVLYALVPLMEIQGNESLCGSEIYSVSNLPEGCIVQWSFQDTNTSASGLLQSNYPCINECIINIDNNENINETLVAKVYHNGNLFATLTKAVSTNWNLTGTYTMTDHTTNSYSNGTFGNNKTFFVSNDALLVLNSGVFNSVALSHTNSSFINWNYNGNETIQLNILGSAPNGETMTITGLGTSDCDNFKLSVKVLRHIIGPPILEISPDNIIYLSLNEQDAELFNSSKTTWKLVVRNIESQQIVCKKKIIHSHEKIDMNDWPAGVYVLQHSIGTEEYSQKVINKRNGH